MDYNMFLTNEECKKTFSGKEIYVFGAGTDAEDIQNKLTKYTTIRAYIDNYRFNDGRSFCGKKIISLAQCMSERTKDQPILVCTRAYAMEICKQLNENGLIQGLDYYVWDDRCIYHYNEDIKEWIAFCNKVWKKEKRDENKKILIPFSNTRLACRIKTMYCAQYFAQKYNASICGYTRHNAAQINDFDVSADIYKACNVNEFICLDLSETQEQAAKQLCDELWDKLYTWEDWKNIRIYGISFGSIIVSNFLRRYVPSFDLRSNKMYSYLSKCMREIVFWYEYINKNDIKAIFMDDGVTIDGFIRDIAITKGIRVYVAEERRLIRLTLGWRHTIADITPYLKEMWNQLTTSEQEYGLKWAEQQLAKRMQGGTDEVASVHKKIFTFAEPKKEYRLLEDNDKIKIIICPHIFEENALHGSWQIFDENYFSWLCHLGELSEITPKYDWYVKMHPMAHQRDHMIINMIIEKYPKIKKIQANVSPMQLKEEGARFALTICGTIGHEFPQIGIQVINAGDNPHIEFNFNWNPKTKEEYDNLIMQLDTLDKKVDMVELYKFYSLFYLYYAWLDEKYNQTFFKNELLSLSTAQLSAMGKEEGAWIYREFMNECSIERHNQIFAKMEEIIEAADNWKPYILYKRNIDIK